MTDHPCSGCPFKVVAPRTAVESGDPCVMLCHESGSLDGDRPDIPCVGWQLNMLNSERCNNDT